MKKLSDIPHKLVLRIKEDFPSLNLTKLYLNTHTAEEFLEEMEKERKWRVFRGEECLNKTKNWFNEK